MPESHIIQDGRKFMWDGVDYESKEAAEEAKKTFEADNFEVRLVEENDKAFIYSRRAVTEVVVDGEPPSA